MDDMLPSYESATKRNHWELVARYLPSDDLCSAALVCQKWHDIFTPRLWGNPASHFGVQNDTVYVALARFKRTLFWSRLCVRELTHTLHLPPAHAEIYGGPHSEWLRECLERLPRLQSLIVNGLPFFDHAALLTLRHSSLWWQSTHPQNFPVFGLRLLDASGCKNATSIGLSEALPHFPDLVSLDLSRTLAAKDETVFSKLKHLRNLRILKLIGLGLKDADLEVIAPSIGTRVRCLYISENNLTDTSVRLLLDHCIKGGSHESHQIRSPLPPIGHTRPSGELDVFGVTDLDSHLRKKLTQGFFGSLAIEEARNVGLTHLYLSKNAMTVEGVSGLLRSKRLQVLDVGSLPVVLKKPRHPYSVDDMEVLALPGVEKLTTVLAECGSEQLVYLRLNYTIITRDAPLETAVSPIAEAVGDGLNYRPDDALELDSAEIPPPELDANNTAVYELPGDTIQPLELPVALTSSTVDNNFTTDTRTNTVQQGSAPTIEVTPEPREVQRGPAYAPEVVQNGQPVSPTSPVVDASGGLSPRSTNYYTANWQTGLPSIGSDEDETISTSTTPRPRSTHFIEDRRARLNLRQSQENRLHPGMLPKVQTLVLTDVPTRTDDKELIERLIQFIEDCAEEATIARIRAQHTYALPPGRSRNIAERDYARSVFALRRIVLEMAPPDAAPKKISTSWRQYPTKSSTEDEDSEAFWTAATHDFSFFSDEECGLPSVDSGCQLPLAAMDGLMLAPKQSIPLPNPPGPEELGPASSVYDVVGEIARFRKDKEAAYQALVQLGYSDPVVEGYWPGDITIVRKPIDPDAGNLDFYGNRFESGWYYR